MVQETSRAAKGSRGIVQNGVTTLSQALRAKTLQRLVITGRLEGVSLLYICGSDDKVNRRVIQGEYPVKIIVLIVSEVSRRWCIRLRLSPSKKSGDRHRQAASWGGGNDTERPGSTQSSSVGGSNTVFIFHMSQSGGRFLQLDIFNPPQ